MKKFRVSLAAALILTGLVSILYSETRRLTAKESAAIGACASRYYVCNGHCQNSPAGDARASCEAECLRVYNACVEASVPTLAPTDQRAAPSPSAVAPATPTPTMPRNISPQRGTSAATTTTKPVATVAPRGVAPKQAIAIQTPTPVPRDVSSQRGGGPGTTVNSAPQPTIVPQSAARRLPAQPTFASPTPPPTPTPKPLNYSRRPIGGAHRTNPAPTPTISPQNVPQWTASTASPPPAQPVPTMSLHRSTSHRKSHRRHRSTEESPTPVPTPQPTPG